MSTRRGLGLVAGAFALLAGVGLCAGAARSRGGEGRGRVVIAGVPSVVAGTPAVPWYPEGTPDACVEQRPTSIAPGAEYSVTVLLDGRVLDGAGAGPTRFGGGAGFSYCLHDRTGLANGRYEVRVEAGGVTVVYDAFYVGGDREVNSVTLENTSSRDVCFARLVPAGASAFGPNDLVTPPLRIGEIVVVDLASGTYALQAVACDGTLVGEQHDMAIDGPARVPVSG
jgi:hypothetical protein